MPEELLNADNGALAPAAEPQAAEAAGEPAGVNEEEGLEPADAQGAENTESRKDRTKQYSERLNRDREAIRREVEAEYAAYRERAEQADAYEMELRALREGRSVDEIAAELQEQEQARRELIESDPEVQRMRSMLIAQQEASILNILKKEFPEDKLDALPDEVKSLLIATQGRISPAVAYRAVREENIRSRPPAAEMPGSVKGAADAVRKDTYSREEVEAMTDAEVEKNYDAVMASMKKWK